MRIRAAHIYEVHLSSQEMRVLCAVLSGGALSAPDEAVRKSLLQGLSEGLANAIVAERNFHFQPPVQDRAVQSSSAEPPSPTNHE